MTEEQLSKVVQAQVSEALQPQLLPIIADLEAGILSELKNKSKSGNMTLNDAVAATAKLCLLDSFKDAFDGRIRRAKKLREEMNNDNQRQEDGN